MSAVTGAHRGNVFYRYYQIYSGLMKKHPYKASAINTSVLMGAGDVLAQTIGERKTLKDYDYARTVRFFGVGLLVAGPTMNLWYSSLDKVVRGTATTAALKKVFWDQSLFLPVYLAGFIGVMSVLRAEETHELKGKFKRDFGPLLLSSYELWPAVQIVNFYMVPLHQRILVINFVSLFWNSYISWKSEIPQEEEGEKLVEL